MRAEAEEKTASVQDASAGENRISAISEGRAYCSPRLVLIVFGNFLWKISGVNCDSD